MCAHRLSLGTHLHRSGYARGVTERTALIVAAGDGPIPQRWIREANLIVAADGGLANVVAAGLTADVVVGDMDSVDGEQLRAVEVSGAAIERHPVGKDESDLELALQTSMDRGADRAFVVVRDGGRLDHSLANLAVLASPRWQTVEIDALVGGSLVWPIHSVRTLPLAAGAHLSLHAMGGTAEGVVSRGVLYTLDDERLDPLVARGIANVVEHANPTVELESGVLLAISSP